MITIAEAVAQAAESKVGVRESGGPNKGSALQPFFGADSYDPNGPKPGDDGYAWCASFVCWCVMVAVAGRSITFERPTTPSAWGMEAWSLAQDRSTWTLKPPGRDIQRGDIVVFNFSHVGIAVGPVDANGFVPTVEGNTNAAGSREGDGVYRKLRSIHSIRSRIRFR
jgi:cell wall-associated NlpC family hydrolase